MSGPRFNHAGEVADYTNVSQFEYNESAYECGFFTIWLNRAAGQPGHGATENAEWIDEHADSSYTFYDGLNLPSNTNGMSAWQEWQLLREAGLNYRILANDKDLIKAWVTKVGAAVIIAAPETSIIDLEIGKVPYSWKPSGSHIITLCGVSEDGNFLARDTANVDDNGPRPGPRKYDAAKLQIISATAVLYSWLPSVPANYDPRKDASVYPQSHTYTIRPGDTLAAIASEHGTSAANLLSQNEARLDAVAREYGYANCREGSLIFPGTTLEWV